MKTTAGMLMCAAILITVCVLAPTVNALCADPSPLTTGSSINILLLIWVDAPYGLFTGDILSTTATSIPGYGISFSQPYLLGISMYGQCAQFSADALSSIIASKAGALGGSMFQVVDKFFIVLFFLLSMVVDSMRAHGPLPLPNGQSVTMNFVYFNLANKVLPTIPGVLSADQAQWDYSLDKLYNGYPIFLATTALPTVPGSFTFPGLAQYGLPAGDAFKLVSTDPNVLMATFGVSTPFTFIVPPALFLTDASVALANLFENALSAVIVHPFLGDREAFECDGLPAAVSLTPDCAARNRTEGVRRFNVMHSTLFDTTTNQYAALDYFHTLGIRSVVLIFEPFLPGATGGYWTAQASVQYAKQLNIKVLAQISLEDGTAECVIDTLTSQLPSYCAPADIAKTGQVQVFGDQQTPYQMALNITGLAPEALIIAGTPTSAAAWAIGELFRGFQQIDYTPQMVSFGGGMEAIVANFMPNGAADMVNMWNTKPFDPMLNGPSYRNEGSKSDFQLFPATKDLDSPAVFTAEYEKRYGPARVGGAHPFYSSSVAANSVPAIAFATLERVQKMIETGMSRDAPTLISLGKGMSCPGMYGQVRWDEYGRTQRVNEVLQQQLANGSTKILAPYSIGQPVTYPLPTWKERSFTPHGSANGYSDTNEKILLAITSIAIAALAGLLVVVMLNWREPVIRASTPSFAVTSIVGCIIMCASNYFAMLDPSSQDCAASAWLLTVGFSAIFSSLFIKTFRIWRIFGRKQLQVLKMRDQDLLMAVGAFILIDIIINAAWIGAGGMQSSRVMVDPDRPAYDYLHCETTSADLGAIAAHLAIKGGMLLFGVVLTYSVRNVPSQFNESVWLGVALYNCVFILSFGLPIIATGIGGRSSVYLIRGFIIIFIACSTIGLLYIPKILVLMNKNGGDSSGFVTKVGGTTTVAGEGAKSMVSQLASHGSSDESNRPLTRTQTKGPHSQTPAFNGRKTSDAARQQGTPVHGASSRAAHLVINASGGGNSSAPMGTPVRTPQRSPITIQGSPISPSQLPTFDDLPPAENLPGSPNADTEGRTAHVGNGSKGDNYRLHVLSTELDATKLEEVDEQPYLDQSAPRTTGSPISPTIQ